MLHWFYVFSFFALILLTSLAFLNNNLLGMLLVSECVLVLLFILGLTLGSFFNLYYVLLFSFFVLVLGGLELALNLLLLLL